MTDARAGAERIRDLIMMVILAIWSIYAVAAVVQLFTTGAKVLDSLPPFWFWGIPLAPYSALYTPWTRHTPQPPPVGGAPAAPEPPPEPAP